MLSAVESSSFENQAVNLQVSMFIRERKFDGVSAQNDSALRFRQFGKLFEGSQGKR